MELKSNAIYCGDCEHILVEFPSESVDLIYIDPPFFSNRHYEVLWGDGYELRAFEDRWKGGIENYVVWMENKLIECYRILKKTGSLYLHCDYHANAQLRLLLDRIFNLKNFRDEIIWAYEGGGRSKTKQFARKHDTIFFFVKGSDNIFNMKEILLPHTDAQLKRYNIIKDGMRYANMKGKLRPLGNGKIPSDVWVDIPPLSCNERERLGYPTQKPEALLERIIKASSNPKDIVLDPMCGCGTAIAVAHKLGRQWIGIDVSPTACRVIVDRMQSMDVSIHLNDIVGLPRTLEELKAMEPFEFQNWVCKKLNARLSPKKSNDMGIDGWLSDGRPLQVKQSRNVGRNVIDNFETAVRRAKKKKGIIVAFSFGRGAYEEVARAKLHDNLEIELKLVDNMMEDELEERVMQITS